MISVFSLNSFASERIKLLVLPLSDGTSSVYSVDLVKSCSFEGVSEIHTTHFQIGKKSNWLIENVNLLQNKINFEIAAVGLVQNIFPENP